MIKVLEPGLYTSIQDNGRFGYRNIGVPVSGCMDEISAGLANKLLNNPKTTPLIEITLIGPKLLFLEDTQIAITGANFEIFLNDLQIENNEILLIKKNDILSFGKLNEGFRAYISVKNGIVSDKILNSASFYKSITRIERFKKGDLIKFNCRTSIENEGVGSLKINEPFFRSNIIDVFKGPEFELFSKEDIDSLLIREFTISHQMNRMGIQLNEQRVKHNFSIITSPVLPGTVQCTSDGKLIVLMKDAQTTGGYPRIFQLTKKAIAIMAQKQPNERVIFKLQHKILEF